LISGLKNAKKERTCTETAQIFKILTAALIYGANAANFLNSDAKGC
jgi:hypothetical protein